MRRLLMIPIHALGAILRFFWDDIGPTMPGIFTFIAILIILVLTNTDKLSTTPSCSGRFDCRDKSVQLCIDSERYTRDECIVLVGGE